MNLLNQHFVDFLIIFKLNRTQQLFKVLLHSHHQRVSLRKFTSRCDYIQLDNVSYLIAMRLAKASLNVQLKI